MSDIRDLLHVVHEMHRRADAAGKEMAGKSSEGVVSVTYPSWWDVSAGADPTLPESVSVYSYLFGPSRDHVFRRGSRETHQHPWEWVCVDPIKTAIRVITTEWAPEYFRNEVTA